MSVEEILKKADNILSAKFKEELRAQGHYNTGALEQSLGSKIEGKRLEGFANHYLKILNEGYGAERASMKQLPFLIRYFQSKGYEEKEAKSFAVATIKTWMRDGMPTKGSYRFSKNGYRTQIIDNVNSGVGSAVNHTILSGLDSIVSKKFHETKSGIV